MLRTQAAGLVNKQVEDKPHGEPDHRLSGPNSQADGLAKCLREERKTCTHNPSSPMKPRDGLTNYKTIKGI